MSRSDFLIIGGGIAGISAAARVSHLGSVTLLEAEDGLGYHATGRSAAMFLEGYGNDAVRALNRASRDYLRCANDGVLGPRGIMTLARSDQRALFEIEAADHRMEDISVKEACDWVPILNTDAVAFVAVNRDVPEIDTDLLLQNFVREAKANAAQIITHARVDKIAKTASGWTLNTAAGSFTGNILINAAGAWVDQVATMAGVKPIGFQPFRRSIARLPAPGGHDVSNWPLLEIADQSWYAKPDAGKWLVSPAEEDAAEPHDAFADDMVLAEGIDRYQQMVSEEVTRLETSWAGLRTFAPDRALVIGFDAGARDFFWIGGQGGYGFQTSPAASQLAAELLNGGATTLDGSDVLAFDPARFG